MIRTVASQLMAGVFFLVVKVATPRGGTVHKQQSVGTLHRGSDSHIQGAH